MIFYFVSIFILFITGIVEIDAGMLIASALFSIALEIAASNGRRKK